MQSKRKMLSLVLALALLLELIVPVLGQPVFAAEVATEATETASDMLANATYAWSAQDWTGSGQFSYSNEGAITNGADSLRSWRFSRTAQASNGYARLQIDLKQNYDMTGKDLVFDVKADPAKDLTGYSVGIVPYGSDWKPLHDFTNNLEYQVYFKGDEWATVTVDNSILKAYLESGKDLSSVRVLYLSFNFPAGEAQNIYIDNMRLVDHTYGTDATDAAADLLANATVVSNGANGSTYTYEHGNTLVAYGNDSNSSHKFSAAANAADMFTVKYDLGASYDLTNKNIVLDMLSYRGGNGFAFSLYNSKDQLVSYAECYTTVNEWAEVKPAILAGLQSGKNLSDVRYIAIGARFASNTTRSDRAFYVDNVRIESIDTHFTALQNKNVVFMGDSITAAYGYKGWSGELQEHYLINKYNIGVGGASFATCDGRTTIYAQKDKIPNVDVDFFVLNGGFNDIWSKVDLGAVSDISVTSATVNSFDTNTTAGAMEQMFCYLSKNYPNAKIGFVINYFGYSASWDGVAFRDQFVPLAKQVCEKWGVSYLDLTTGTTFNGLYGIHTYDGVHGNDIGYELVMRKMAPWLISLCDANEQTEQNSDLLSYAKYHWSATSWNSGGALRYDQASTVTMGDESTRSWMFSATSAQTQNAGVQLALGKLDVFALTGRALQFNVKFEGAAQSLGLRLYDKKGVSVTGDKSVWVNGNGSSDWQTITVDASKFQEVLASGCSLDDIHYVYIEFNFAANAGKTQNVYIDNFRVVNVSATEESEQNSDLLYGAGFVEGSIDNRGFGYDQHNTTFLKGADSKYSLRLYAEDDKTAWITATYILPHSIDLTTASLQFDVNQYNQAALWVALYDSNYELITSDNYSLREEGWQTFEVNTFYGFANGKTVEDLKDIRYIRFSLNMDPANTGRMVVIDNLTTYENEQIASMASGLVGLYLGDSLSEGHSYKAWAGEMAEHYGIYGYNVSTGGRTLSNDGIYKELANAPTDVDFDFIMLDGGVNDYWSYINPGVVTPEGTTVFDTATPIGGLEKLFYTFSTQYPDTEVFFVLAWPVSWSSFQKTAYLEEFVPLAREACQKWGVHLLDLVDNPHFRAEFDDTLGVHTYDGLHPNTEGYHVITPYVVSWLEEVMCADAKVRYQQLSLGDDLSMRFDLMVSSAYQQTATVTVTVNGETVLKNVSYSSFADGMTGCKKIILDMAAAQMTDSIVITVTSGAEQLLEETYSVQKYIKYLLEGNYNEKTQELAKAVLNYGAAAQVYFDHNADSLANEGYENTEAVEIPEINIDNMLSGEVDGIRFYGASLLFRSKIAVRFYFAVDGDISNYSFSTGNSPVLKDGLYYVEIPGINPQDYAKEIQLLVSNSENQMQVTYSPMYYIGRMYNTTSNDALVQLLGAMYQYHLKAVEYVTEDALHGQMFSAGVSTFIEFAEQKYNQISFDYKLTTEGTMAVVLRGPEWIKYYGIYDFDANGVTNSAKSGITCEPLEDGYIHVTMNLDELNRTLCVDNRDGAPETVTLVDIYETTTAEGYIDNVKASYVETFRGDAFTGNDGKLVYLTENAYESLTFDYKLTNSGSIRVLLRDPDAWVKGVYGDFYFDANGETKDYAGITCEKLSDGYIRVTMKFAEIGRTGLADNRDSAPEKVGVFDIYSGSTGDGYVDNIQIDTVIDDEPADPEIPPVPAETTAFAAGTGKWIKTSTAYESITFDYKLDGDGVMGLILRDDQDWLTYYGGYYFNAKGETVDYAGVTTKDLGNGYIRVTLVFDELTITSPNGAPANVEIFDIYGSYTTVSGAFGNVEIDIPVEEEPTDPEIPPVPAETTAFAAGTGKWIKTSTAYESITFDYKLDGDGVMGLILRDDQDWLTYYGGYYFNTNGETIDYAGVTSEALGNGYIRVTMKFDELTVMSPNGAPANVEIFDVYGSYTTVSGAFGNVEIDAVTEEEPDDPEVPDYPVYPGDGELVTVTFADVQLMAEHRGNTVNGPKALRDHLNYAKSIDADVLFMPGDVVNNAVQSYYDRFWTIFKSVYGENKSLWPEIIWTMGNHEWYDTSEKDAADAIALFKANAYIDSPSLVKMSKVPSEVNPGQTVANYYKVVNGVPFVVISGDSRANTVTEAQKQELIGWLDEICELPTVKAGTPIYVAYHLPIADVTYFGQGATDVSKVVDGILKNYPNAIVFTGDTHCPGINERTINQIDYTSINLGSSSYSRIVKRSATSAEGDKYYNVGGNAKDVVTGEVAFGFTYTQNLMVLQNSTDGSVVMDRYITDTDPADIRKVGITWNFPSGLNKDNFIYTYDRFENKEWANTLYGKDGLIFADDASVSFSVDGTEMIVYFDDVTDHNYAEHYKITVTADGTTSKTYDVVGNYFKYYEEAQTYHFQLSDIPAGTNYTVEVKAYDFFDNESLNSLVATSESATSLFPDKVEAAISGTYTDISTRVNYEVTAGGVSSLECYYRGDYLYTYGATLGTLLEKNNLALADEFTVTDWSQGVLTMKVKNDGDVAINVGLTVVVNENGTDKWVTDFGGEYRKVVQADGEWAELTWDLNELFGIDSVTDVSAIRLKASSTAPSADGYTMHLYVDDIDVVQGEGDDTDEPAPVNRGKAFSAGVDNFFYLDTAGDYDTLSFDYKTDGSGEIAVIFRGSKWTTFYGDFRLTEKGEKVDYVGITTEVLEDGYIRATFNLKELQRSGCADNRNTAPVDVALIDLYQWTTVNGYIDNITVS